MLFIANVTAIYQVLEKYNTKEMIEKIIVYGSIDGLGKKEKIDVPTLHCDIKEYNMSNKSIDAVFIYLYKNGCWYYQMDDEKRWSKLTDEKIARYINVYGNGSYIKTIKIFC